MPKKYTDAQLEQMHTAVIDELFNGTDGLLLKMTSNTGGSQPMMVHGQCRKTFQSTHKVAIITVVPNQYRLRPNGRPYRTARMGHKIVEEYSCNHQFSRNVSVHIPRFWWCNEAERFLPADDWWPKFMAKKGFVDFGKEVGDNTPIN